MPDKLPKPDPNTEAKAKLRQIKADATRAVNIMAELDGYYAQFLELRAKLDDEENGLSVNLDWSQKKRTEIENVVTEATEKLSELSTLADQITKLVADAEATNNEFVSLATKMNNPTTGIQAMVTAASQLVKTIEASAESAEASAESASDELAKITTSTAKVEEAYDGFTTLMLQVNDPETGIGTLFAEVQQYAKDALKAKTSAESELASVISLNKDAAQTLDSAKQSRDEIDGLKDESQALTNDIRDTLGLTAEYSLSKAIKAQREKLDRSLLWWGVAVVLSLLLLIGALGTIFYYLFVDNTTKLPVIAANPQGSDMLLAVVAKALFTSPFVFALAFSTTHFGRTRVRRDKYLTKETNATNLQSYVKLLRDEFPDYEKQRLDFALKNMQAIYDDPADMGKKRSFNFGVNRIFQFRVDDEDAAVTDRLFDAAEEIVDKDKPSKP